MKWQPIMVVLVPAVAVLIMLLLAVNGLHRSADQRLASCAATQIALDGVIKNAAAGIRPVSTVAELGAIPDELRRAFREQRDATIAENARRRAVIAEMTLASKRLAASDFCSTADWDSRLWWP